MFPMYRELEELYAKAKGRLSAYNQNPTDYNLDQLTKAATELEDMVYNTIDEYPEAARSIMNSYDCLLDSLNELPGRK